MALELAGREHLGLDFHVGAFLGSLWVLWTFPTWQWPDGHVPFQRSIGGLGKSGAGEVLLDPGGGRCSGKGTHLLPRPFPRVFGGCALFPSLLGLHSGELREAY